MNGTEAERFFYDHAGYSHGPEETAEQGRERCARELAAAEAAALAAGWWATTEEDPDVMDDDAGSRELVESGQAVNLTVVLWGPPEADVLIGRPVEHGSLGGVVVASDTDPYVRVVAAELAAEAIAVRAAASR